MAFHSRRSPVFRRARVFVGSPRNWRARLVFWAGALAIGLVSAAFARASDRAFELFSAATSGGDWHRFIPLVLTPATFVLSAWLAFRFFPGSQGSGIPQAMAANMLRGDYEGHGYLSLRTAIGKLVLTVIGLAGGAAIGREGPTVQIGAALMSLTGRVAGAAQERGLILAGSAAGIAAAFNAPLAGIVFAIEELSGSYQSRTTGLILMAVIIAGLAAIAANGPYAYFGVSYEVAHLPGDLPLVLACGIFGGVLGGLFSRAVIAITRRLRRIKALTPVLRAVAIAFAAGTIVAILGVMTGGMTFGTSYAQARAGVEGQGLPYYFFPAKLAATLASTVSGVPGGLFAPSLSVGAGMGSVIGALLGSSPGLAAVLGMAGYFAGVVQAPLTAFVIILEMTGNHQIVVPLMATAAIAHGISRLISAEPLYHALSRLWIADALRRKRAEQAVQP